MFNKNKFKKSILYIIIQILLLYSRMVKFKKSNKKAEYNGFYLMRFKKIIPHNNSFLVLIVVLKNNHFF
jgi:hypothetical protein